MKRLVTTCLSIAAAVAVGVVLMPAPASAATAEDLTGVWVGEGRGRAGHDGTFYKEQARLVFKKAKDNTFVANYQWRLCDPRPNKCKNNDPSGGGWSGKDRSLFVLNLNLLTGVENEAMWEGVLVEDGSIYITFREMQNSSPNFTPFIATYHMVKVS